MEPMYIEAVSLLALSCHGGIVVLRRIFVSLSFGYLL